MNRSQTQLSKTLSYALRHAPWEYELELDDGGWVPVAAILGALQGEREAWHELTVADIEAVIAASDKRRFELADGRIRALYGHSVPQRLAKEPAEPPGVLYHGTVAAVADAIRAGGLQPMTRQYVHLSVDTQTAAQVAARRRGNAVIFRVDAAAAHAAGVPFYRGNERVWLADRVPPRYLALTP